MRIEIKLKMAELVEKKKKKQEYILIIKINYGYNSIRLF